MKYVVGALLLVLASYPTAAQEMSREATLQLIGKTVAEINARTSEYQAGGWGQTSIDVAIQMAVDLRDRLSSNPYVRVSSVSVGIPYGVSFEFTFPDASLRTAP